MKKSSDGQVSRHIESSQDDIHQRLAEVVTKHLKHPFRKPYAAHNQQAFQQAEQWLNQQRKPLILDSFCGVGESTWQLAERFPGHAIIGVDKSAARLNKHAAHRGSDCDNYLLLRADVDDFWRLAVAANWQPEAHYLLYPNPWPKPSQLSYRVQGSPLFPSVVALGGRIELRSNWPVYVREFAAALEIAGQASSVEAFNSDRPLTPFERKYQRAGQLLWRCVSTISHAEE